MIESWLIIFAIGTSFGFILMLTSVPHWKWWLLKYIYIWDVTFFLVASYLFFGTASGMIIGMMTSLFFSIMLRIIKRGVTPEEPTWGMDGLKPTIKFNRIERSRRIR